MKINQEKEALIKQWNSSGPVKYFFIDNLLPKELILQIYNDFPNNIKQMHRRNNFRESKKTFAKINTLKSTIIDIIDAFHDIEIVKAISSITKIKDLEPDPELYAGGISRMDKGDFLNPHIDNSHDKFRKRYRRLNLLYYISPNWTETNGGNLELWDKRVLKRNEILSKYNRLVVMNTNKDSWHSVNKVMVEQARLCVSNYYFSKRSSYKSDYYHVTSFMGRPNQKILRSYSLIDNLLRQFVASTLKISRGKKLSRNE